MGLYLSGKEVVEHFALEVHLPNLVLIEERPHLCISNALASVGLIYSHLEDAFDLLILPDLLLF